MQIARTCLEGGVKLRMLRAKARRVSFREEKLPVFFEKTFAEIENGVGDEKRRKHIN